MGNAVYITRARDWRQGEKSPIPLAEWRNLVEKDPQMRMEESQWSVTLSGDVREEIYEGSAVWIRRTVTTEARVGFRFIAGNLRVEAPDALTIKKMKEIAAALGATVQDENGEVF